MSAADIIREIRALPPEAQLEVIAFSRELDQTRERTREEFLALAKQYQDAEDPTEVARLEDELVRGFYGPGGRA